MATTSRKLTGGAGGLLNYFEERELPGLEEYYRQRERDRDTMKRDRDDAVFTEVWGTFAERLGLTQLTRAQFTDLVNGEWEGERLVGAGYRKVTDRETGEVRIETGVRTTMIDVVYAAPKSVVMYLVHQDDPELRAAVIDAWRASVREAFETMQEYAKVARVPVKTPTEAGRRTVQHGDRAGDESRMQGSATKRVPAEYIALPVLQLAARPTEESLERGYVADPHLHMHVPVIAVVAVPDPDNPDEYRTYTPDEVGIKRQAAERDAILMGEFARRLEDLGIDLEYHTDRKGRVTWEVAGIPREASLRFSTNHVRAERLAEEFRDRYGRPPTDPELGELLRMTRLRKDAAAKQVDERGAWQAWHDDLRSTGIDITAREPRQRARERASLGERYEELRDRLLAPDGLHREDSIVDRETVRQSIARSAVGLGLTREELRTFERRFVSELIPVRTARDPEFDLFALPHHIEAEVWIGTDIEARAAAKVAAPTYGALQRAMSNARVRLSQEQREAVKAMASDTGWENLIGRAGTGKTTVLRTVADALRDTTGRDRPATDRVIVVSTGAQVARSSAESIGADRWYSIDGFATAADHGLEVTDRTWVFVDEAAMVDTRHMKMLLNAAGPAVIRAIGDDRQLPAIGAAGWYAEQLARHPGAELTHVYRQRNPDDVRDFIDLGVGRVEEAVRSLHARDRIHVLEDPRDRVHAIVDLYVQERAKGRGPQDVAVIVDGSNQVLDDLNRRIQRERLVMEEISPRGLEVRATDEDRRWSLHRGDLVLFRERIVARDEVVRNGDRGRIVTVDHRHRQIAVALEDGRRVTVDVREEAHTQPVVPAYAVNVNVFQGSEVAVGIYSPSRHADRHSAHTAVTRVVEDLHVVIDRETYGPRPITALTRDWSRVSDKRTAWSQLAEPARAKWAKWKRGEDTGGSAPERERVPVREEAEPVAEVRTPEEVMAAAAARPRSGNRDDVSERERRDAEADEATAADEREADGSLVHDVDVPPRTRSRFGDIDAMMERHRDRTSDLRYRRDAGRAGPDQARPVPARDSEHEWTDVDALRERRAAHPDRADSARQRHAEAERPADEHRWVDLEALRARRLEDPAPMYRPPDRDNAR